MKNVLILTPDAVGSTLLQRLITIYMQFHDLDRPVINLHELSNGLVKYFSTDFNQEIVGKKPGAWGYHQSLNQIVELLDSVSHYKTSRLAQYHIKVRKDPISDQVPFYRYLNENFYIISCRRRNIFEHALSWSFNKVTSKLNVYSPAEKINTFAGLYKEGIEIDTNSLVSSLDAYKDYLKWVDQYFHVASYFEYETHIPVIEKYILSLPIFPPTQERLTWQSKFNISLSDWNKCSYLSSDIGSIIMDNTRLLETSDTVSKLAHLTTRNDIVPMSHDETVTEIVSASLSEQHRKFLSRHKTECNQVTNCIEKMKSLGIIISGPPIKKQTFAEKKFITRNFNQLVDVYNSWAAQNQDIATPMTEDTQTSQFKIEEKFWHAVDPSERSGPKLDHRNAD